MPRSRVGYANVRPTMFNVRVPPDTHARLKAYAAADNITLNRLVTAVVTKYADERTLRERLQALAAAYR